MDIKSISVEVKAKGIIPAANALGKFSKTAQEGAPAINAAKQALEDFAAITLDAATSGVKSLSGAIRDIKTNTKGISNLGQSYKGVSTSFSALATAVDKLNSSVAGMAAFNAQLAVTRDLLNEMKGSAGVLSSVGRSAGNATVSASSGGGKSGGSGSDSDALTRSQQNVLKELKREVIYAESGKIGWLEYKAAREGVTAQAAPLLASLRGVDKTLQQGTMSTKAYRAAMNTVPAQLTDIATQLAGGQNPFLIMLQQGGQLRDVFGSVGGAAKALGSTLLSALLNPWTLLAIAVGATAFAFYKAATAQEEIQKALILTNNYVGLSTDSFNAMSKAAGEASGRSDLASEAMLAIASSAKIAGQNVERIATSSAKFAAATGQDIDKVVEEYASLAESPVEALDRLDTKYRFLTTTQRENLAELKKQGKEYEATAMAETLLADAHDSMTNRIVAGQGLMSRGWADTKASFGNFWQSVKDSLSGGTDHQDALSAATEKYNTLLVNRQTEEKKLISANEETKRRTQERLKSYDAEIASALKIITLSEAQRSAEKASASNKIQEEKVKAITKQAEGYDEIKKRQTEINKLSADMSFLKTQPQTKATLETIKSIEDRIKKLNEQNEPKKLSGGVTRQNTLEAEYEAILLDIEGYTTKGAEYDKMTEKGKRLLAVEKALANPKKDTNIAVLQEELKWLKLIVAEEPKRKGLQDSTKEAQGWLDIGDAANVAADAIDRNTQVIAANGLESSRMTETQKKLAEAQEASNKATDYGTKMAAEWAIAALERKNASEKLAAAEANSQKVANDNIELAAQQTSASALLRREYHQDADATNMDSEAKKRHNDLMKLSAEVAEKVAEAEGKIAVLRGDSTVNHEKEIALYEKRIEMLKQFGVEQTKIVQNAPIKPDIQKGWESFYTSIGKAQDVSAGAFSSGFSLMENTLSDFFMTGKMDAQEFGKSMLKIIVQMTTKLLLLKAVQAMVGMGSSVGTPGSADFVGPVQSAQGNAFSGASQFAQGGSFTNGIYSKPTAFQFASGGGFSSLGVMGEERSNRAGEAVMPLTRTRQGDLGVNVSGQSSGGVQVNTTINIVGDSATTSTSSDGTEGKQFANMINTMIVRKIAEEKRPGGMLAKAA
jgi:lambda family phage tail tape measure protein